MKRKTFNEKDAAHIIQSILSAIAYCHEKNVIHRDLKPENILIEETPDKSFKVKVIDFGASLINDPKKPHSEKFGTVYYVAPEVLKGKYNT